MRSPDLGGNGPEVQQTMKKNSKNVRRFQSPRKFLGNPTEQDFTNSLKTPLAEKLSVLAEAEGVDPECLIFLAIARVVREHWDFTKDEPRKKRGLYA